MYRAYVLRTVSSVFLPLTLPLSPQYTVYLWCHCYYLMIDFHMLRESSIQGFTATAEWIHLAPVIARPVPGPKQPVFFKWLISRVSQSLRLTADWTSILGLIYLDTLMERVRRPKKKREVGQVQNVKYYGKSSIRRKSKHKCPLWTEQEMTQDELKTTEWNVTVDMPVEDSVYGALKSFDSTTSKKKTLLLLKKNKIHLDKTRLEDCDLF